MADLLYILKDRNKLEKPPPLLYLIIAKTGHMYNSAVTTTIEHPRNHWGGVQTSVIAIHHLKVEKSEDWQQTTVADKNFKIKLIVTYRGERV